jgi:hypothetical protein
MTAEYSQIDFHKFVNDSLEPNGFRIVNITQGLMLKRLDDFMNFVNSIRTEYKNVYGWNTESKEYFLNGLVDKFKYSYAILNNKEEICFLNFSSVYGDMLHTHCSYAGNDSRNRNFAKIHMIKIAQTGLDNGYREQGGYWPKNNNGSIILYLKMGWEIKGIRNNKELIMTADLEYSRNRTYKLLTNNI